MGLALPAGCATYQKSTVRPPSGCPSAAVEFQQPPQFCGVPKSHITLRPPHGKRRASVLLPYVRRTVAVEASTAWLRRGVSNFYGERRNEKSYNSAL